MFAGVERLQFGFSNAEVLSFTICVQTAYLAAVVHLAVHAWYFKKMLGILDYGVHKMDSKSCYEIGQSFKLFP